MKPLPLISRSQEQLEAIYSPYSDAERMCMGYGAASIWMLIAPERFGKKLRAIGDRKNAAINALRDLFHSEPCRGKHIKRGRRTMGANLLLRDLV